MQRPASHRCLAGPSRTGGVLASGRFSSSAANSRPEDRSGLARCSSIRRAFQAAGSPVRGGDVRPALTSGPPACQESAPAAGLGLCPRNAGGPRTQAWGRRLRWSRTSLGGHPPHGSGRCLHLRPGSGAAPGAGSPGAACRRLSFAGRIAGASSPGRGARARRAGSPEPHAAWWSRLR